MVCVLFNLNFAIAIEQERSNHNTLLIILFDLVIEIREACYKFFRLVQTRNFMPTRIIMICMGINFVLHVYLVQDLDRENVRMARSNHSESVIRAVVNAKGFQSRK